MSNVLIGIIGVILFIGLALAGALILGDDFRTASSSSQAAAAISQIQQIQAATEMWRLKTGQSMIFNQNTAFLQPRFLKTAYNPTQNGRANAGSYLWEPHFNNDIYPDPDPEGGAVPAAYAMIPIGPNTEAKSLATCQAIADQFSGGTIVTAGAPAGTVGCSNSGSQYVVWGRIGS